MERIEVLPGCGKGLKGSTAIGASDSPAPRNPAADTGRVRVAYDMRQYLRARFERQAFAGSRGPRNNRKPILPVHRAIVAVVSLRYMWVAIPMSIARMRPLARKGAFRRWECGRATWRRIIVRPGPCIDGFAVRPPQE